MTPLRAATSWISNARLGRWAFRFLAVCAIAFGALAGWLFVNWVDLPEVRTLEEFRPNVVTELYSADGQVIGSFALQRRVLLSYDQIPSALRDAVIVTEDQHFFEHWGVDLPRVLQAAWHNVKNLRVVEGASTLTMQLAGTLFLDRTDRSLRRKIQEALLAIQIERYYTKQQIFTLYANQIYLAHGNYGFAAASQFYFGKSVRQLSIPEAALLAGLAKGPGYSPILNPRGALARRNLVLRRLEEERKISREQHREFSALPLGLRVQAPRNDLAPYYVEEIRKHLEQAYGTEAVHERGLRVYTTLDAGIQRAANRAVRDALHAHARRRGWRGNLPNILRDNLSSLERYEDSEWRRPIEKGQYVSGLVLDVEGPTATIRVGPFRAVVSPSDFAWTGRRRASDLFQRGDLGVFRVREMAGNLLRLDVEQKPMAQGAFLCIENSSGEVKAMVGGYSFEESKFNRATQALRQVGSSFKPYLYTALIEQGFSPFDTVLDAPLSIVSGDETYSPSNYDGKFEGTITLRRALAGSRNVPAVRLAEKVGIENVVETSRRFGITSPLPPYLPLVLGAADLTLMEHTSAFTAFPNEGIRIEPHLIRRVETYEGSILEEARPRVSEAMSPEVARMMVAMLAEVVAFGTGVKAQELKQPSAGKTGTTNEFSDAWYIGFTPSLTAGAWIGNDDKRISLGNKETGARAALPVWLEVMKAAYEGKPVEEFTGVEPLSKIALTKSVQVDTPDSAPTEEEEHDSAKPKPPKEKTVPPPPPPKTVTPPPKTQR
jgi:penicillin-binding protein 1A